MELTYQDPKFVKDSEKNYILDIGRLVVSQYRLTQRDVLY
jgi:hypothetical protein